MATRQALAVTAAALAVLLALALATAFLHRATRSEPLPLSPVDPDAPSLARAELRLEDDPGDVRLELALRSALLEQLEVDGARIEPATIDGEVVLGGTVPSAGARTRALAIAREAAGSTTVRDGLAIDPLRPRPGRALASWRAAGAPVIPRLLAPRTELAVIGALGSDGLRVQAVSDGATVRLEGEVPTDVARAAAVAAAAGTDGVAAVDTSLATVPFSPIAAACAVALDVRPEPLPPDGDGVTLPTEADATPAP